MFRSWNRKPLPFEFANMPNLRVTWYFCQQTTRRILRILNQSTLSQWKRLKFQIDIWQNGWNTQIDTQQMQKVQSGNVSKIKMNYFNKLFNRFESSSRFYSRESKSSSSDFYWSLIRKRHQATVKNSGSCSSSGSGTLRHNIENLLTMKHNTIRLCLRWFILQLQENGEKECNLELQFTHVCRSCSAQSKWCISS